MAVVPVVAAAMATGLWAMVQEPAEFPHSDHEGLFPLCSGCHAGIETGIEADAYPTVESCNTCHDGVVEERVEWAGPSPDASNLAFSHTVHVDEVDEHGESADCTTCHQEPDRTERMAVQAAPAEGCLTCHAHEAPEHFTEERDCAQCHVELREATELSVDEVAAFSEPGSHEAADFQGTHGTMASAEAATCAFCHSQDSCARCHMNGADLEPVQGLPFDSRVSALVEGVAPEYEEPATHTASDWELSHGALAISASASCANCHTEPSCRGCHTGTGPESVLRLPTLEEGDPRGVQLALAPRAVHRLGFETDHGALAASSMASCEGCHTSDRCTDCHDGPGGGFHASNFLQMHGPEAYGRQSDCATCHSTEVFCRACHSDVGLGGEGRLRMAFHSAQPQWLLGHGNAARQGLESCATCHRQVDCMQCHAAVGSWSINPHGPDFDGERMSRQNVAMCNLCHRVGPE